MKKIICIGLIFVALSGCEQGLTTDDSAGETGDETGFSFSDMYSKMKTMQEEIDLLKTSNAALTEALGLVGSDQSGAVSSLSSRLDDLEGILAGVTRIVGPVTGQPTILFSGVNVQVVNGLGYTNGVNNNWGEPGTVNGLGNFIVGYRNTISGRYTSVSGGYRRTVADGHNVY
ncbi:MAG: hypothetical protein GY757_61995 [bacterium]|nr:hypothetical protein [bacterium]